MTHKCTSCGKTVAVVDNSMEVPMLQPAKGVELTMRLNEAPRCKCICGKVMILLTGSAI